MRTGGKKRAGTSRTYVERVNRAIDYILSHLAEPLSLTAVASAAELSPFHFHRVFQALIGETVAEFVKRLRLERALHMMAHGRRQSLTQIAFACGFASSSDFSRCFRQRYGASPRCFDIADWRAKHRSALVGPGGGPAAPAELERLP